MPRTARLVVPNYIYCITQRGNYRQHIFQDDEDRLRYLSYDMWRKIPCVQEWLRKPVAVTITTTGGGRET